MRARKPQIPQAEDFEVNNAENYAKRATAFGKARGYDEGSWPVVRAGEANFEEWMGYFERIGHAHGRPRSFARMRGVLTVPAPTPEEFEPGWRSRESVPFKVEKKQDYTRWLDTLSPEERAASREYVKRMAEEVKRSIASASMHEPRRHSLPRRYRDAAE